MRILYLNHNPWNWILQRSQILALEMEKYFQCDVIDKKYIPTELCAGQNTMPKKMIRLPQLRGGGKFRFINFLNKILYKMPVRYLANKYDVIWLCYPTFVDCIPSNYKGLVIYDCMDNHVALAKGEEKQVVKKSEHKLLKRADLKLASAKHLIENIDGLQDAILVRNGFVSGEEHLVKAACKKDKYKIGYFGALEKWFDYSLLYESTNRYSELEYHLIGPVKESVKGLDEVKSSERFYFEGVIPHDELGNVIADYDALIMPFILNDIILSVDPVKLYEYIYFGKCVISIWYPEIERFSPFVYFYKTKEEYYELIKGLIGNGFKPKYTQEQRTVFLSENSWEARGEQIRNQIIIKVGT